MHREKRKGEINKTYQENNNAIASQDNMLDELKSLWDRIEERIDSLSGKARHEADGDPSKEVVEDLNRIKLHRKKVKDAHHQVETASDEEWRNMKEDIQDIYTSAISALSKA